MRRKSMVHDTNLEVLPIPVHLGRQNSQLFQGFLNVARRRFCEVIVYSPCIGAILLQ